MALERVKMRVLEGAHNIPQDIIIRRYYTGLKNLLTLYNDKVDYWLLIDNSKTKPEVIAEGHGNGEYQIKNQIKWAILKNLLVNDSY